LRKYQKDNGDIPDPVDGRTLYSPACYAHSVATLVASGFDTDPQLLESGMRAMDYGVDCLAKGLSAFKDKHSDFYTYPVMLAFEQFQKVAPTERLETWRKKLGSIDPRKTYATYNSARNNWTLVHTAGEFLRSCHGLTDLTYVDHVLEIQRPHLTALGMYREHGAPFAYDAFSRYFLTGMVQRGYRGSQSEFYRDACWKGAWTSLLIQSPFGEMPTGYRSAHHIWNEAELAKVYEIYAAHYAKAGRPAEAGAFKRGAHLALNSIKQWIRPDGSGYIVKNRYPIAARQGYEGYSLHVNYNLLACSMLCAAWLYGDDAIEEKPAPADVGGFVVQIPDFDMVIANAGGTYVQYMTRGNHVYNPTGLIRIHLKDGHPQLGPSDGVVGKSFFSPFLVSLLAWIETSRMVGDAVVEWWRMRWPYRLIHHWLGQELAVGPVWKTAARKVEVLDETTRQVRFRVTFDKATETLMLNADGVRVEDETANPAFRVYYPILVFDGREETKVKMDGARATLELDGRGVQFTVQEPADAKLVRLGKRLTHRNGLVEPVFVDIQGAKAVYSVTPTK
jgi:hypothetical protein